MQANFMYALLRQAVREWSEARIARMGAALAYYTIFSLAPLLLIATGIASLVFGEKAARGELALQIRGVISDQAADTIEEMLRQAHHSNSVLATVVGLVLSLVGASTVFLELQDAFNSIWRVKPMPGREFRTIVRGRALSFALILLTGFFLIASLAISTALAAIPKFSTSIVLPGGTWLWQISQSLISFVLFAILFALIFKFLPDVFIRWRHVWTGAFVTSLLFLVGKYVIGIYLGRSTATSAFGAAGSLAALLVWVYYSAQILLFGALLTRVHSSMCGDNPLPTPNAAQITPATRATQLSPATNDANI